MDALGHGDQQPPALGPLLLDGGQELLLVKVGLGQVHQVLAGHLAGKQGGCGGDPPGIAAHELHHHHVDGQGGGVEGQLQGGHGGVLGRAPEAWAVVRHGQIVVDGLGDADDPQLIAGLAGQLVDLVAGVHGVVAAVVEKVADVEVFEALQHRGVVSVGELPPAGAQGGGGGAGEQVQLSVIKRPQVHQVPGQDALGAEPGAVDGLDLAVALGLPDGPQQGAVDHRGGSAAVGDEHISFQHMYRASLTPWQGRRPSCTDGRRPA